MEEIYFRADLHIHTCYSDGTLTPEELMIKAKENGLAALSITDHDSIAAYEEAIPLAAKYGLKIISGIEFSATLQEESVHILGYSFSLKDKELNALCQQHRMRRFERNNKILNKLKAMGIVLNRELFQEEKNDGKSWGRPHIAQALIDKGVVSSIQEAFDLYLAEGRKAYDPGEPISVEETLETIHKAGGFAILAHPHLIKKRRIIKRLLNLDFDGLEGYYARLSSDQEREWLRIAGQKKWLITGGSDYHGSVKPYSQLGSSWVNEETFRFLYERFCASQSRKD